MPKVLTPLLLLKLSSILIQTVFSKQFETQG
jgi:hypothetical protein